MNLERGLARTSYGHIHYRTAGRGRPVMLFSINQQSSDLLRELALELAEWFHVIAMDYPSHGMSDHIREQPRIGDYAQCAREVLDALGVARVSVLGEATGAGVAAEFCRAYADRAEACVLVNCPYAPPDVPRTGDAWVRPEARPQDDSGFPVTRTIDFVLRVDPVHAPMAPTQDWMDRINRAQVEAGRERWQAITALREFDMAGALRQVACPTLVLAGEHFYFGRYMDEVLSLLADARAVVLPGARFCMTWEKAAEVAAEVRDFASFQGWVSSER